MIFLGPNKSNSQPKASNNISQKENINNQTEVSPTNNSSSDLDSSPVSNCSNDQATITPVQTIPDEEEDEFAFLNYLELPLFNFELFQATLEPFTPLPPELSQIEIQPYDLPKQNLSPQDQTSTSQTEEKETDASKSVAVPTGIKKTSTQNSNQIVCSSKKAAAIASLVKTDTSTTESAEPMNSKKTPTDGVVAKPNRSPNEIITTK